MNRWNILSAGSIHGHLSSLAYLNGSQAVELMRQHTDKILYGTVFPCGAIRKSLTGFCLDLTENEEKQFFTTMQQSTGLAPA